MWLLFYMNVSSFLITTTTISSTRLKGCTGKTVRTPPFSPIPINMMWFLNQSLPTTRFSVVLTPEKGFMANWFGAPSLAFARHITLLSGEGKNKLLMADIPNPPPVRLGRSFVGFTHCFPKQREFWDPPVIPNSRIWRVSNISLREFKDSYPDPKTAIFAYARTAKCWDIAPAIRFINQVLTPYAFYLLYNIAARSSRSHHYLSFQQSEVLPAVDVCGSPCLLVCTLASGWQIRRGHIALPP